ncbi:hypothetical protein KS407_13080 [Bacillus alkalicola]|uniref:Uncharacterized protein n=1 Tax=Evansella alkalicola TaxID=745819 RepID=A0ABS6JVE7_9BACI|nr:hypothetical protein [Bacillus alkalicola]
MNNVQKSTLSFNRVKILVIVCLLFRLQMLYNIRLYPLWLSHSNVQNN